jgi:hypothetical protein
MAGVQRSGQQITRARKMRPHLLGCTLFLLTGIAVITLSRSESAARLNDGQTRRAMEYGQLTEDSKALTLAYTGASSESGQLAAISAEGKSSSQITPRPLAHEVPGKGDLVESSETLESDHGRGQQKEALCEGLDKDACSQLSGKRILIVGHELTTEHNPLLLHRLIAALRKAGLVNLQLQFLEGGPLEEDLKAQEVNYNIGRQFVDTGGVDMIIVSSVLVDGYPLFLLESGRRPSYWLREHLAVFGPVSAQSNCWLRPPVSCLHEKRREIIVLSQTKIVYKGSVFQSPCLVCGVR